MFTYLCFEELLIFKCQRKDADKLKPGESWIESNPAVDIIKMLLCCSKQEFLKATIYCFSL